MNDELAKVIRKAGIESKHCGDACYSDAWMDDIAAAVRAHILSDAVVERAAVGAFEGCVRNRAGIKWGATQAYHHTVWRRRARAARAGRAVLRFATGNEAMMSDYVKPPHPSLIVDADPEIAPPVGRARIGRPVRSPSIFPPCSMCGGRLTAEERHWYGTLCEGCAHKESDAYDAARGQPCPCRDGESA